MITLNIGDINKQKLIFHDFNNLFIILFIN